MAKNYKFTVRTKLKRLTALEKAVLFWWEGFRPNNWGLSEHITLPKVNMTTVGDQVLAEYAQRIAKKTVR